MNALLRNIAIAALLLVGSVSRAHAQTCAGSWTQRSVSGPVWRRAHAMAYDAARGVTVLFGGIVGDQAWDGQTWEWNGTAWTQRAISGPSPRCAHAMAYDSARGVTVLFGGFQDSPSIPQYGDTWEWNGTAWSQRMVSGPSPRHGHRMVYDTSRGVTVLFGGFDGTSTYGETWEWNGSVWTQRMVSGPSPRGEHALAYDAARGVTVVYGGILSGGGWDGETWEWNGTVWTQRMVSGPTFPRGGAAMIYDVARGVTVLFGGGGNGTWTQTGNETWEWDGSVWTLRTASGPSARADHAMAHDAARGMTVLFGGYAADAATWEFTAPAPAKVTQQPAASIVNCGGNATFTTAASGPGSLTYRWRRGGINLNDGATGYGSFIVNSATTSMSVVNARAADSGGYDCVVTNACLSATSIAVPLTVLNCCKADFNGSGTPDVADIFAFLSAWFAGCP